MKKCMGVMAKNPKINGRRIRFVRSISSSFQFRFLMAKYTPMPDTKNRKGILQMFNIVIGTQIPVMISSLLGNPINIAHG
jgi:hypothetical protein